MQSNPNVPADAPETITEPTPQVAPAGAAEPAQPIAPPAFRPAPMYAPRPPVPPYALEKRDRIFAAILFALSVVGLSPAVFGGLSGGFGVSFALLFTLMSVYLGRKGSRADAFSTVCGVLALLSSAVFCLTSGTALHLLSVCAAFVLSVVWFCALAGKSILPGELGLARRVLRASGQTFASLPRSVRALFTSADAGSRKRTKALLGLLCALPVFCVVVVLLSRSDAAFEGLTKHLFVDAGRVVSRLALGLILFPFLLAFGFSCAKDADCADARTGGKGWETSFLASFLGLLSVAYLVYLFSQLAYFFSAFSGILPAGYTFSYAEYARRGFFELCGIAAINLTLLYLTLLLSRKTAGKLPVVLRALGTFIDLFTLLLIGTAMAKMILYIRRYGTTVLRLGTSAFMLFMAVVFLALLVRFFTPKLRVLPIAAVCAAVILLVLGVGNLHAFCARYNYEHYRSGDLPTVDTKYLHKLGDEGVPYLLLLRDDADEDVRESACVELYLAVFERYEGDMHTLYTAKQGLHTTFIPQGKKRGGLYEWTVPRARAYALLDRLLQDEPAFMGEYSEKGELAREETSMLL